MDAYGSTKREIEKPKRVRTVVTLHVHGSDETAWNAGEQLGLTGAVLSMFSHALDEITVTLDVDRTTGRATITHVDGRWVATR